MDIKPSTVPVLPPFSILFHSSPCGQDTSGVSVCVSDVLFFFPEALLSALPSAIVINQAGSGRSLTSKARLLA